MARLKPAALSGVNGNCPGRQAASPEWHDRLFHFGTFWQAKVQPVCNTPFEFGSSRPARLDKIAIPQHAAKSLAAPGRSDSGSTGLDWGRDMKFVTGLLAAVLVLAGVGASHAVVRIAEDRGGRIGTYVDKYQDLRSSGEAVIIDGLCASACTIVLGAIPHDKICVTSNGRAVTNAEATQMLYSMYPSPVRRWISQRGGLTPRMLFLRGKQLMSMYRPCYLDAQASVPRPSSARRDRYLRQHDVIAPAPAVLARQPD